MRPYPRRKYYDLTQQGGTCMNELQAKALGLSPGVPEVHLMERVLRLTIRSEPHLVVIEAVSPIWKNTLKLELSLRRFQNPHLQWVDVIGLLVHPHGELELLLAQDITPILQARTTILHVDRAELLPTFKGE
jgi:hypothetical protein